MPSPTELDRLREECRELVRKRALISAGAAVVPVPMLDMVVDAGILLSLIPEISQRFGLATEDIDAMDPAQKEKTWRQIRQRGSQLIGIVLTRQLIRKSFQGMAGRLITRQISVAGNSTRIASSNASQMSCDCTTVHSPGKIRLNSTKRR